VKPNYKNIIRSESFKTIWMLVPLLTFLTPFLILCCYNYPGAEDYAESVIAQQFGFWAHVKDLYLTFDGRYFAAVQMATNPLVYKSFLGYKLLSAIFFVLLPFGFFLLLRVFFNSVRTAFWFTVPLTIVTIGTIPTIPFAFYYMVSSMVYLTPTVLSLFLMAVIHQLFLTNKSFKRLLLLFISVLLILAIVGSNEMFTGLLLLFFGFLLINGLRTRTDIGERALLFFTALCGAFMVITAPGVHEHFLSNPIPLDFGYVLDAGLKTLSKSTHMIGIWISEPTFWIVTIIYLIISMRSGSLSLDQKLLRNHPVSLLSFALLVILILPLPYYFSLNEDDSPGRVYNVVSFFFNIWWLIVVFLLSQKISNTKASNGIKLLSIEVIVVPLLCLVSVFLARNWTEAVKDVESGTAQRYDKEMRHRFDLLNSSRTTVILQPIKSRPLTYTGIDLGPNRDTGGWNECYEIFFDTERVYLEGDDALNEQ
jgi:hypothetical protein